MHINKYLLRCVISGCPDQELSGLFHQPHVVPESRVVLRSVKLCEQRIPRRLLKNLDRPLLAARDQGAAVRRGANDQDLELDIFM
jgi:hypothetical protein